MDDEALMSCSGGATFSLYTPKAPIKDDSLDELNVHILPPLQYLSLHLPHLEQNIDNLARDLKIEGS